MSITIRGIEKDTTFRQERVLYNMKRILDLIRVYIAFVSWILLSNLYAFFVLDLPIAKAHLYSITYGVFLLVNILYFIFFKRAIKQSLYIKSLKKWESLVFLYILAVMGWGAITSIIDFQLYVHTMVYTLSILFCAALLYIKPSQMIFAVCFSSIILIIGTINLHLSFFLLSFEIIYVLSIILISLLLSRIVYSLYKKSYISNRQLQLENKRNLDLTEQLRQANQQLEMEVDYDFLTKLYNRRGFLRHIHVLFAENDDETIPLTAMIMDIDYFKNYNDFYGHKKGDIVLHTVAQQIQKALSQYGFTIARWGGEEFVAFGVESNIQNVQLLCQTLCDEINALAIPHEKSDVAGHITISVGSCTRTCSSVDDVDFLINNADKALYSIKGTCRNSYAIFQ